MPRIPVQSTRRYWVPVGSEPVDTFPFDPDPDDEDWYRFVVRPDAKTLSELSDVPCLFLLGDPGLGKSTAIKQEVESLKDGLPEDQGVLLIDLAVVSSDAGFVGEFDDPVLKAWKAGAGELHLFLDSYDESLRQYSALKPRLLRWLASLPIDRLRLRIACRSGEFPGKLPDDLLDLWASHVPSDRDRVLQVRLEPLGRWDVLKWAEAAGIDGEGFLQTVDERNARAFASRPITLKTLLTHSQQNDWPTTEVGLFAAACQDLCAESNLDRSGDKQLTTAQRMVVAERIAALTLLANTNEVQLETTAGTVRSESALPADSLTSGFEDVDGTRVNVDQRAIEDTLRGTALFGVQNYALIGWSQRTYQEFLAARYFARRLRNKTKALPFFEHDGRPGSTERYIAPQLTEAVAWLAAMDEDVAQWIAKHDPAILLRTRHYVHPTIRPQLASWLLAEERVGRTVHLVRRGVEIEEALGHSGLCDLLGSVVIDNEAAPEGRALTCHLAAACNCSQLENELLALAMQPGEPSVVRRSAVTALGMMGSATVVQSLLPLLEVVDGRKEPDELWVETLLAVWPQHRSTGDILNFLSDHLSDDDSDLGWHSRRFVSRMGREELRDALVWIEANASKSRGDLEYLLGQVMTGAASHLEDEEMRTGMARAMVARLDAGEPMIPGIESSLISAINKKSYQDRLAFAEDLVRSTSTAFEWYLGEFIIQFDLRYEDILDRATIDNPVPLVWSRVLTSHPITRMNNHISQLAAPRPNPSNQRLVRSIARPSRKQRIGRVLDSVVVDPVANWISLVHELNSDEISGHWVSTDDLANTPGWQEADESQRQEILEFAQTLLTKCPVLHPSIDIEHHRARIATAGYQAATLLAITAPKRLEALDGTTWQYWLPGLATIAASTANRDPFHAVMTIAYQKQPLAIRSGLAPALSISTKPHPADALLQTLDLHWNADLASALYGTLANSKLPLASQIKCLAVLVRHEYSPAIDLAFRWIQRPGLRRDRAIEAAGTILINGTSSQVARLVKCLSGMEQEFTRVILQPVAEALCLPLSPGRFRANANEQTLADLYILTAKLFLSSEDDNQSSDPNPWSDPSFPIVQFCGALLRWLTNLGTWAAIEQLERIIDTQPPLLQPRAHWHDAMQLALRATWIPSKQPQVITAVVANEQQRIVRNSDQLLDLVLESLERLQTELITRGAAADLWSEWWVKDEEESKLKFRPKQELSLSDYVKRFFDRDLFSSR